MVCSASGWHLKEQLHLLAQQGLYGNGVLCQRMALERAAASVGSASLRKEQDQRAVLSHLSQMHGRSLSLTLAQRGVAGHGHLSA